MFYSEDGLVNMTFLDSVKSYRVKDRQATLEVKVLAAE